MCRTLAVRVPSPSTGQGNRIWFQRHTPALTMGKDIRPLDGGGLRAFELGRAAQGSQQPRARPNSLGTHRRGCSARNADAAQGFRKSLLAEAPPPAVPKSWRTFFAWSTLSSCANPKARQPPPSRGREKRKRSAHMRLPCRQRGRVFFADFLVRNSGRYSGDGQMRLPFPWGEDAKRADEGPSTTMKTLARPYRQTALSHTTALSIATRMSRMACVRPTMIASPTR